METMETKLVPVPAKPKVHHGKAVRKWWRERDLAANTDLGVLAQALADVGMLSLGWLARRLTDKKTPPEVKDEIALAMGPKLAVEVRGKIKPGRREGESAGGILDAYKITGQSG